TSPWTWTVGGGRSGDWRYDRLRNFSGSERDGGDSRIRIAGSCGVGCGRADRALRGILLRGTRRNISQSGRAVRVFEQRARAVVGISFRLDERIPGAAGSDGDARRRFRTVPGFPVPRRWDAAVYASLIWRRVRGDDGATTS